MKTEKPDRFEGMVKQITRSDHDAGYSAICFPSDVAQLLRKEHRRTIRTVKAHLKEWKEYAIMGQIPELIDKLKRGAI